MNKPQAEQPEIHSDVCKHCIKAHVESESVTDLSAGFLTREVAPGIFMLTNGNYQSLFLTTGEGVVLIDAPEPLVKFIAPAISDVTVIIGVSGAVGRAATQIAHWKKAHVIGASTSSENPSGADAIINITTLHLEEEVRKLTQGKGVDLVVDAVGGSMFEHGLKALRRGGRQIAITTTKDRKVSFDLLEFYHNQLHLIGVDTMKLSGTETADLLQSLRFGFQEGYLQAPTVTTWPLERALEAYMAVEKGGSLTKQVLIPHPDSRRMV